MSKERISQRPLFILAAFVLLLGLLMGFLSSLWYIYPDLLSGYFDFSGARPMHVSLVLFWILIGSSASTISGLQQLSDYKDPLPGRYIQYACWLIGILGVLYAYLNKEYGGREYWVFPPRWSVFFLVAWCIHVFHFLLLVRSIKKWPVYIWMWMTGSLFFLFIFIENYLWLIPYFRNNLLADLTLQWKVNGSMVGAWNQLLYGTAIYLTDRISGDSRNGNSKIAFAMYLLGLFNLMFNWGHHVYTLPTTYWVKYIGYAVSMTEWIFFIRIIRNWKNSLQAHKKQIHLPGYSFIVAAEVWAFIQLTQALLMSIPALNLYTHGTHITVAHAMATTIGINSMILIAAFFHFIPVSLSDLQKQSFLRSFKLLQGSLLIFWISLNYAGIMKALWQHSDSPGSFSRMMDSLQIPFTVFCLSGFLLATALYLIMIRILAALLTPPSARG